MIKKPNSTKEIRIQKRNINLNSIWPAYILKLKAIDSLSCVIDNEISILDIEIAVKKKKY